MEKSMKIIKNSKFFKKNKGLVETLILHLKLHIDAKIFKFL